MISFMNSCRFQASKDVLAMASLEVDLTKIEPGQTITVKWRGKPVFIKRRTEEDIELANSVNVKELRDPQTDSERTQNPEVYYHFQALFGYFTDLCLLDSHLFVCSHS